MSLLSFSFVLFIFLCVRASSLSYESNLQKSLKHYHIEHHSNRTKTILDIIAAKRFKNESTLDDPWDWDYVPLFKNLTDLQNNGHKTSTIWALDTDGDLVDGPLAGLACEDKYLVIYHDFDCDNTSGTIDYPCAFTADKFAGDYNTCLRWIADIDLYEISPITAKSYIQKLDITNGGWSDPKIMRTTNATVCNLSNVTQEGLTSVYAQSVTNTHSITWGQGLKIAAKTKLKIPFVGSAEISAEISGSHSETTTVSSTVTIQAPAQKVRVEARHQIIVYWVLSSVVSSMHYRTMFMADESNLPPGLQRWYKRSESGSILGPFNDKGDFSKIFNEHKKSSKDVIFGPQSTQRVEGNDLKITIGEETPVDVDSSDLCTYVLK